MTAWREICKVRIDHGVRYVRLPRSWCDEQKVGRGSFMVLTECVSGELVLRTLDAELENDKTA